MNDTKPIWIYCGQTSHCQKGMAMVINQNMSDTVHTLDNYKLAAAQVPIPGANMTGTSGGAPPGINTPPSTSTSTFTAAATPAAATTSAAAVPSPVTSTTASAAGVSSPTSVPSVGTFTGEAIALQAKKMVTAAGVLAVGVAALL